MPLLLLDLDNTLVDRAAAFRRWAGRFIDKHGADRGTELDWLLEADADGYEQRDRLAVRIRERFGLGAPAFDELVADLRWGMADYLDLDPEIPHALRAARAAGWEPVVVTNGTVEQQERKLRMTGLDKEVSAWVISEAAGVKKPGARIFEVAARAVESTLDGAWVIGDSAEADIAGADRLGLKSVWLHRGREWHTPGFMPTSISDDCPQGIRQAIA